MPISTEFLPVVLDVGIKNCSKESIFCCDEFETLWPIEPRESSLLSATWLIHLESSNRKYF